MILMVAYGGGHIAIMSRIYEHFVAEGEECTLLPLTTALPYCEGKGMSPLLDLQRLASYSIVRPADESWILDLACAEHNPGLGIPFEHTLNYYRIGVADLIEVEGPVEGRRLAVKFGRFAFKPVLTALRALQDLAPKAVFTTNVARSEEAFRSAAQQLDIPCFSVDDLIGTTSSDISADIIFVDNEIAEQNLLQRGYTDRIVISGNPVYDSFHNWTGQLPDRNKLLVLLQTGIRNLEKGSVHLMDSDFYSVFFADMVSSNFLDQFDRVNVRFHPSMNHNSGLWNDTKITIDTNSDIHDSLKEHGSVVGFTSTAVYEAYLAGATVYPFTFGPPFFELPFQYPQSIDLEARAVWPPRSIQADRARFQHESACDIIYSEFKGYFQSKKS